MKKVLALLAVVVFMTLGVAGCQAATKTAVWEISIEQDGKEIGTFTDVDADDLDIVEIDVIRVKKDGSEIPETWKGVLLADVLENKGIKEYSTITIEASDGYAKDFDIAAIQDPNTIFGMVKDGKDIDPEDGPVQIVAGTLPSSMWIKNVSKITVNE